MKNSLKLKLILGTSLVVALSVLVISISVILIQYKNETAMTNETGTVKVSQAASDLNLFFQKPISIVNTVSHYLKTHEIDQDQIEEFFEKVLANEGNFSELYFASSLPYKDGGFFYANDRWTPPADYDQTTRAWYKAGQAAVTYAISDPYLDSVTNSMVSALSTKITDVSGSFTGVVGLDISLKNLDTIVSPIKISRSGRSYLLDKNGNYVTNSDTSKLMNVNFFSENKLGNLQSRITEGSVFYTDNTGNGTYFAAKVISKESGWIFVTVGPRAELFENIRKNLIVIVTLAIIALVVSCLVAGFIATSIVTPIISVDKAVNNIASGDADLTRRVDVRSNDEIGSMVTGFNKFTQKLQDIIRDVKGSKDILTGAGEELVQSSEDTASAITEIIANIESMYKQINNQSSSVSQTAGAVNQIASNIESLEHMIDHQSSGVSAASAAVEEMIGNIRSVNTSVEKMANSFEALEQTTKSGITKQLDVNKRIEQIENQSQMLQEANQAISNIAEQTNLLAMNAAIEAAHAGEAGKGFAVVADEIRKLSETSSTQSKTIGEQLNNIKESISTVVAASSQSSAAFTSVSVKIQETDELVHQIKAAMSEQTIGSKQISDALHSMNNSTVEVHAASTEMSEGNKVILEEIKNLQNATTVMKGSMEEMKIGAQKINETGMVLNEVSGRMKTSIKAIGNQIDQFKV